VGNAATTSPLKGLPSDIADWTVSILGEIGSTYGGLSAKSKDDFGVGEAQYIPFLNVLENVRIDPESLEHVRVGPRERQNHVRRGDLLFNNTSETPTDLAMGAVLADEVPNLFLNSFCFGFRLRHPERLDPMFIAYMFRGPIGRRLLYGLAQGATRYNLSKAQFKRLELPLPDYAEQRAISRTLADADESVRVLDSLIAKKRAVKRAAVQQLLTAKTRLPGFSAPWKTVPLGDVLSFRRSATNSRADLGSAGDLLYLHYGDIHAHLPAVLNPTVTRLPSIERSKVAIRTRLQDGDLVLVDASEDLEGIGKSVEIQNTGGREIVPGLHTIVARGESGAWAPGFKAYLQFNPAFKAALTRVASGISVYATSRRQIADISLPLPDVDEQHAIATVFSDMDAEIQAMAQRRTKAASVAVGMMQALLTGRARLYNPEAKA
jgi:type I restriction enzyme S subunit